MKKQEKNTMIGKTIKTYNMTEIEIGSREVIIDKENDLIKVGCKTIYTIELQQISDLMRRCDFDTIQLDDHSPVSLKTINQILAKL